jgi:hypothetical protein
VPVRGECLSPVQESAKEVAENDKQRATNVKQRQ